MKQVKKGVFETNSSCNLKLENEDEFDSYKFIKEEFGFSDGEMAQWRRYLSQSKLADFGNVQTLVEKAAKFRTYTKEDLKNAFNEGMIHGTDPDDSLDTEKAFEKYIETLPTRKNIGIENEKDINGLAEILAESLSDLKRLSTSLSDDYVVAVSTFREIIEKYLRGNYNQK